MITDIKKTIAVGLANGDSYTRMAQRIADSVGKDYRKAMRIVRTEANRAINRGFQDVSEEASDLLLDSEYVEVKEWCSMEDESVRNTHRHLNGKVVHAMDVFHSKGRTADCPGDFGAPEEDINCRCFLAYRFLKREDFLKQGGVIPDSVLQKEVELRLTWDEEDGIIKETDMFRTKDDPMREVLGSAEESHPEKVKEILEYLKSVHVDVIIRDENESMGYQPGLSAGKPGQIVLNKQASISAWMHEVQHVKDDEKAGWSGMKILFDNDERYQREKKAYNVEIEFAQQLDRSDIVERLLMLLDEERKRIYDE